MLLGAVRMKLKRIAKAVALIAGPVGFMLVCVLVIHALYLRASDRAILEDLARIIHESSGEG